MVVTAGVRAMPGVLIVPLEEEFHWSRARISFALGINLLLYGAIGRLPRQLWTAWDCAARAANVSQRLSTPS